MTKTLLIKTFVATLVLGAAALSTPASAGERCRGGAIVEGDSYYGHDYTTIDAGGCSETYYEQTEGGNRLNVRMRDRARTMSTQTGRSRTDIDGSGQSRIGSTNHKGVSRLKGSGRGQIASYNDRGYSDIQVSGTGAVTSDNRGGTVRVRSNGGRADIKVH